MEEKKKSVEQTAQERTADNLMNCIIAKTFARHAEMSEEEYLKAIGFEGEDISEDKAVRVAVLNVLTAATKAFIQAKQSFSNAVALLRTYLTDETVAEKEKKNV